MDLGWRRPILDCLKEGPRRCQINMVERFLSDEPPNRVETNYIEQENRR